MTSTSQRRPFLVLPSKLLSGSLAACESLLQRASACLLAGVIKQCLGAPELENFNHQQGGGTRDCRGYKYIFLKHRSVATEIVGL